MNAPVRTFAFAPAVRERVSLIIALAGASGGGKTLSALKLARGLAGDDSKIAVIDTEAGRAKHYAVAPGESPGPDRFAFHHGDLRAPFSPEAYADAIRAADDAGFEVIVIDSCSHEYESEGGLHDMHDALVDVAVAKAKANAADRGWAFDEARERDKASVGAWREPKARHKRFVSRLLQCRAHLVLCLRAEEKIRIEKIKDERGRERTVIVQPKDLPDAERWVPICEKRFMYEMTLSLVITPPNPGVPIPVKLQAQHRACVPLNQPITEDTGRALAEWAKGGAVTQTSSSRPPNGAADQAAASDGSPAPNTSGARQSAAASVPSEEDYIARWDAMLEEAKPSQADDIARTWNAQSKTRKEIWPDEIPEAYTNLRDAVMAKVKTLRESAVSSAQ